MWMAMLRRHRTQHGQVTGAFGSPASSCALTDRRAGEAREAVVGRRAQCTHPNQQAGNFLPPADQTGTELGISLGRLGREFCLDEIEPALRLCDGPRIEFARVASCFVIGSQSLDIGSPPQA